MSKSLTNAEHFDFTNLDGERLDLLGSCVSFSDTTDMGIVAKSIVRRDGAIHQRVGAAPQKYEFRCSIVGADCKARYLRIVSVAKSNPEGLLVHPWFGSQRAVVKSISATTSSGDARDTIEFTISFEESGIKDAPKPSPAALARTASTQGALVSSLSAGSIAAIQAQGVAVSRASAGVLSAIQDADAGLGTVLDVDASLGALTSAVRVYAGPQAARRAAAVCLSHALQARARFAAKRPLIGHTVAASTSLGVLCQRLYGGAALTAKAEILRINRLATPYNVPAGTALLIPDPAKLIAS